MLMFLLKKFIMNYKLILKKTNKFNVLVIGLFLLSIFKIQAVELDNTKFLQAKIDECYRNGRDCKLPNGTFFVTSLNIKCSIEGSGNTKIIWIENTDNKRDKYRFCRVENVNNVTIKNIVFDGNNSSLFDRKGGVPLSIVRSRNLRIENCVFRNSNSSGLRVSQSSNVTILRCESINNFGTFGDSFYVEESKYIKFDSCTARNYNRIGFVLDKNVEFVEFHSCTATGGNNASILRGGTEFNAGFWFEMSGGITANNCRSSKNTHYGFVAVSGLDAHSQPVSFKFSNCVADNSKVGFKVGSLGKNAVNVELNVCQTKEVIGAVEVTCKNPNDVYNIKDCELAFNISKNHSMGINFNNRYNSAGKATLNVNNSKFLYPSSFSTKYLSSPSSFNSDIYVNNFDKIVVNASNNISSGANIVVKSSQRSLHSKQNFGSKEKFIRATVK